MIKHNQFLGYYIEVAQTQGERLMRPPFDGGFVHARVADERQVIVGGEHQHLMSLGLHPRAGTALQWGLIWIDARGTGRSRHLKQAAAAGVN